MGYLFVISGPSAVGKTTVVNHLMKKNPQFKRVITCTTRSIRPHEENGVDYIFLSKEEFVKKIEKNEFAEYSEVYGNYYGVLLKTIKENMEKNDVSILVINWEGFLKIKKSIAKNVFGIFINPPSIDELRKRIKKRNSENENDLEKRMNSAIIDMNHSTEYDFVIKNFQIHSASKKIFKIINGVVKSENSYGVYPFTFFM